MRPIYLIKDLSRTTGFSVHTLKYYARIGLLKEIGRSPETNFRYYDQSSVERLSLISYLRKQGLALKDIKERMSPS